ncbi:hypothetical protein IBT47_26635 [Erwinia sp. S43]|nr:hypothetical protein [Erwinia sp. S43]
MNIRNPLSVGQIVSTNLYNKGRGAVFAIDGEKNGNSRFRQRNNDAWRKC